MAEIRILWLFGHPVSPECILEWWLAYTVARYLSVSAFSTEIEKQEKNKNNKSGHDTINV